ncbi:MAG: beta-ketoacyl synthase N-terminal-like domain-containing protein [Methylobacter sp.]|nr:beta-ketoacyl synthase N-terminal-like domain-containing protein [Methylobacter sp.]
MTEKTRSPKSPSCVQITGMGIVSAIGHDIAEFSHSLAAGKSGIRRIERSTTPPLPVAIGAEIDGFCFEKTLGQYSDMSESLTQSALYIARRAPFTIQTSVISALQAWRQARFDDKPIEPERIGLIIAGHNTTQNYQYSLCSDFRRNPEYLSPRYALQFMDSNQIGVLSEIFNIRGEGFVTGGASASGNVGIIHGTRLIQSGVVDACLVVGVVADLSPMEIQGFYTIGAMGGKQFHDQPEKACRPFDALHEGFIYGQASACLVLESATSANTRNVPGLAIILGGAINLHATATSQPDIDGEAKAMNAALQQSSLAANEIDYLNTHGSSSPLGDSVEIQAIEQVFGDHFPRVRLNATKGLTGHCLNSAGVVETIASVVQMQQGFIHANVNLEKPINTRANFCDATAVSQQIHSAMNNSFGFGGINTSIVLQKNH